MKKINFTFIFVLIFALFTGCTSDFKINETVVKDISDKITEAVVENVDSNIKSVRHDMKTVDSINLNEININSEVGDIKIISHDSRETVIDVNIKAKNSTKERAEKLTKSFDYLIDTKEKRLNIDTAVYKEKIINEQIIVDLVIKLPTNIKNINIKSNVGDIDMEDTGKKVNITNNVGDINIKNSSASYNIKNDAGDMNLQNISIYNESQFYTNIGDTEITTDDITMAKILSIETNVGDIKLVLPEKSDYEATIQEFMEDAKVKSSGTKNTKIKLITHMGSIDLK